MDVFKLAFETTMVGVLAFLWLGIAVDLIYPPFFVEFVPKIVGKNDTLLGVAVLSLAYCIGSAIIPISSQLVNDEHWPVPEDAIRCLVLEDLSDQLEGIGQSALLKPYEPGDDFNACHRTFFERFREKDPETNRRRVTWDKIWSGLRVTFEPMDKDHRTAYKKTEIENEKKVGNILTKFQLMETQILNQGTDKTERLRQLHERIVVLRGAVFNGFSFLLICVFAWIAPINGKAFPWKERVPGTLLAVLLKPTFAWRMLHDEAAAVEAALGQGVEAARSRLSRLVSRDVRALDVDLIRETTIETVAENLNDSLVAPLFWYALFGLPGAAVYRFANTLDAMWGYRGAWEWAGKWSARADDVLSWVPARLTALLLMPTPRLFEQARQTPSPNGGWTMGAMALRLGVRLRKPGLYTLNGEAPSPQALHVRRALVLASRVVVITVLLSTAAWTARAA